MSIITERPINGTRIGNTRVFTVPSRTRKDGTTYRVTVSINTEAAHCNCPATRTCWHIGAALEQLHREMPVAPRKQYRGPIDDDDHEEHCGCEYVPTTPAACAVRATGPQCVCCSAMDALDYFDAYDPTGNVVVGKICRDCAHDSLSLTSDDFPNYQTEADKQAEAEYFRALDAAHDFANHVERVAQAEAAEYEGDEYDGGDVSC